MLHRAMAVGLAVLLGVEASAQVVRTTFVPSGRGHNFSGTPARLPRPGGAGIGGSRLHLPASGGFRGAVGSRGRVPAGAGPVFVRGDGVARGRLGDGFVGSRVGGAAVASGGHVVRVGDGSVAHVGAGRSFFQGTTLNIDGRVRTGDLNLAVSVGADPAKLVEPGFVHETKDRFHHRRRVFRHHVTHPIVWPWWWTGRWWYDYDRARRPVRGPIYVYTTPTPAPPAEEAGAAEAEEELTKEQRAALMLRAGDADGAISLLRSHLNAEAEDAEAMRLLSLALVADGRVREAAAMMSFAYEYDRSLAHRPLGRSNLPGGARGLREAVREAVVFAHDEDTASAWLLVTALMQAEGRDRVASRMLERAFAAGLDERVHAALEAALGG